MLWDLIRDFFVMHVFGGYTSGLDYYPSTLGYGFNLEGSEITDIEQLTYPVGYDGSGNVAYFNIGDWLSTTATIISITIIVVLCCLFVYRIIKLIGGLIR